MITRILATGVLALASLSAYAGDQGQSSTTDLSGLKSKCFDLRGNDQLRPFKVEVTCRELGYQWKESTPSKFQLPNVGERGAGFVMKTYNVPYSAETISVHSTEASCTVLEKWKYTIDGVTAQLTCEDLDTIDSLADFCGPQIANRLAKDSSMRVWEPTGETFSTCPDVKVGG